MPKLSHTVTFLFASDGSLASDGLSAFLQTKSNFLLLSECNDGKTAVSDIQSRRPEIAVIDAQLPDMNARQIIEAVRNHNQDTRIIVLGASVDRKIAEELLSAGADAYIVRSGPSRHLNDAIRHVRDGGKYLAPQLTKDQPVSSSRLSTNDRRESVSSVRAAIEAQALTVAKLEHAMDRAQYAIDIVQQKVERSTDTSVPETFSTPSPEHRRKGWLPSIKPRTRAAGAALVLAVFGFQFAGVPTPAPPSAAVSPESGPPSV